MAYVPRKTEQGWTPVEDLQALSDIARAKKMYETNTDPALRKQAQELANKARQRLGDMSVGSNLNADEFAKKYGVSTAWDYNVNNGTVSEVNYNNNQKTSKTIYGNDSNKTTPTQATRPSVQSVQSNTFNPQDYINQMYEQQKQAQLAQLKSAREKATGELNQQKAELKPQYQGMRNQADVINMQNVQRLREAMANAGLTSSGENVTAQIGLSNARQSALNDLNLQEQQAINDIARRITDLNNPNDELALTSALEAERNRSLLDAMYRSQSREDQLAQQAIENAMREAGLTGIYNGQQTLDYRNMLFNQDMANKQFDYSKYRDTIGDQQWQQQFDWNKNTWQNEFNYQKQQDAIQNALSRARASYSSSPSSSELRRQAENGYRAYLMSLDDPVKMRQYVSQNMQQIAQDGVDPLELLTDLERYYANRTGVLNPPKTNSSTFKAIQSLLAEPY